ncbi:MAG: oligosaccharide flippase family protein [Bacteroidota bacterium]
MVKELINRTGRSIRKKFDAESKTLIKNSSWVFIANFIGAGFAFLRSIVVARGLGVDILGYYTIAIAFVTTIQELLKLNVATGLIKFGAQYLTEKRTDKLVALLKTCVAMSMGSALLSVLIIVGIVTAGYDNFIEKPGLEVFIIFYALVSGLSFMDNIGKGVLKLYYRFRTNSIITIVMDTIEFSIIASVIYFYPARLDYFFAAVISSRLINTVVCNLSVLHELKNELLPFMSSKMSLIRNELRSVTQFTIGHSFSNTLKTFMNQGDVLLLNTFCGATQVGYYAVAKKLAYAVLTITDPLVTSIFPQLSVLIARRKYEETKKMLRRITMVTAIPLSFVLFFAFVFRDSIMVTLYGKEFIPAAAPFFIHLVGAVQGSLFFWVLPLIQSIGMTGLRFRIYIAAIIAGAGVAYLFIPSLQSSGVALGLLTSNLIITATFLFFAFRKINGEQKQGEPV